VKNIRRTLVISIAHSSLKQRAVAFALLLKDRTNDSSVIRNFTIYKLQKLTVLKVKGKESKMHYDTIKKYVDVLIKMGLVVINGCDLYIKKMASSTKHRNIDISRFIIDKTKNVFEQIRELLFLMVQAHKDYVQSLLRLRKNPPSGVSLPKLRKVCKKCCGNPDAEYKEYGLSYKKASMFMGCCAKTAFTSAQKAIKRGWCKKHNRCEVHEMVGVHYREIPGYSYTTENYGFIIRSNTFILSKFWSKALNVDASLSRANRYGISDIT